MYTLLFFNKKLFSFKLNVSKVKLVAVVVGGSKGSLFNGYYTILWIAPLYPWSVPYNSEC